MPTFKDINTFVRKTPDGTEKIQVSATQYVTLQQIANLASVSDADIMGKKLAGFTRAPWAKSYPETDDLTANSTLLAALKAIISSLNPEVGGFTFRIASHSDLDTGAIFQMYSSNNDIVGNIIWDADKNIWGFSKSQIDDQDQADDAIEGVGSTFSFSGRPWTVGTSNLTFDGSTVSARVIGNMSQNISTNSSPLDSLGDAQDASAVILLPSGDVSAQAIYDWLTLNKSESGNPTHFVPSVDTIEDIISSYEDTNGYTGYIMIVLQKLGAFYTATVSCTSAMPNI